MATRSLIAFDNGFIISSIYCHWDGYLENNGKILLESYTDIEKVEDLMDLGDISSLGSELSRCTKVHQTPAKDFSSLQNLVTYFHNSDCEYLYIFNGLGWEYMTRDMQQILLMVPSDVYKAA